MISPATSAPEFAAYLEELSQLRVGAGLNVPELAKRLGVQDGDIRRAEAGTRKVGVAELQLRAAECGTTLEEFSRRLDERLRSIQLPGLLQPDDAAGPSDEAGSREIH